ncbi:MAG: aldo/keto reductase [Clostridia bacterium]|nr:aldo/keto reductase [Clostridia bacterium]
MIGVIQKNFGFGTMRLPMIGDQVDLDQVCQMVDEFIQAGFNYFDTAHGYIGGLSEKAVRHCLTDRYPRDAYLLTDKLSEPYFDKEEEVEPYVREMLSICGVSYFDNLLMHAQNRNNYKKFQRCRAYETCFELKKKGLIRHLGISFHDSADVLEQILKDHPEVEFVQLQLNYLDWEDPGVQSRKTYEVCERYGKQIIIMEPVKGGQLANLPEQARTEFDKVRRCSDAGYALRFCASYPNVMMVLSGMSNIEQMQDNIRTMKDFEPLTDAEKEQVWKVRDIIRQQRVIPCTACRYCIEGCPKQIPIPDLFSCANARALQKPVDFRAEYNRFVENKGRASDCIKCGKCEHICPQHLEIRSLLEKISRQFDR